MAVRHDARRLKKSSQRNPAGDANDVAERVVTWFKMHARDLPWRRTKDPYAIWVSEIMLQQTQVKTVIPYWTRWMKAFPNVQTLATAAEAHVLKLWEGLGYYSRARNLQKAAAVICGSPEGMFPTRHEEILNLPGVGRYTAGAICSIAYGQPTAILDGNVARVLARVYLVRGDVKSSRTQKRLWHLSDALVQSTTDCSALNQGLMELGATVCLPRAPLCPDCPLAAVCQARARHKVEQFPQKGEKAPMRARRFFALLVERHGRVLVRQRSSELVNGGLWEFPNFELGAEESAAERALTWGRDFKLVRTIKHTITQNRITLEVFAGRGERTDAQLERGLNARWIPIAQLDDFAFSSAHARLRSAVKEMHAAANKGAVA